MSPVRVRGCLALLVLAALVLAARSAFVQDDAFISFRYAENLVAGHGLVWNPGGERVEGYTNFAWVLLMAVPIALGIDPVPASQALGLAAFAGTLVLTHRIALGAIGTQAAAFTVVGLLATNATFLAYATGGLETPLQALLVTAGALALRELRVALDWADRRSAERAALRLSLLAGAALWTRLDSAVPFGVFAVAALGALRGGPPRTAAAIGWRLAAPALLLVVPWLAWKMAYYGDVLPNTFYAKAGGTSGAVVAMGAGYLREFVASYWLVPALAVAAFRVRRWPRGVGVLAAAVAAWCGYVVAVGGGFMEFRLLVPLLPLAFVVLGAAAWSFRAPAWRAAIAASILAGSLHHAITFEATHGIATIAQLHDNVWERSWAAIGRTLGAALADGEPPVVIATTAAGAIPYYSGLATIDMHGLSDRWIARHGVPTSLRPGHRRQPTHRYLVDRGVHLVLGHPRILDVDEALPAALARGLPAFRVERPLPGESGEAMRVLEVPLSVGDGEQRKVLVLYLRDHEAVDRWITEARLRLTVLRRPAGPADSPTQGIPAAGDE